MEDIAGILADAVNDDRLYRALDKVGAHKDRLCEHLMKRYESWFEVNFEFPLYDVNSTDFEGQAEGNEKAARGHRRDLVQAVPGHDVKIAYPHPGEVLGMTVQQRPPPRFQQDLGCVGKSRAESSPRPAA